MRHAHLRRGERPDHHDRGPRVDREAPSPAARVHRRAGLPVRLLRQRHGHGGQGPARREPATVGARDQASAERAPLPLRLAQPHPPPRAARRPGEAAPGPTGPERSARSLEPARSAPSLESEWSAPPLSRRRFLQASGALVIGFSLAPSAALGQAKPAPLPGSLNTNRMLDAWLRIAPNGTATIFTGKIELGQGIGTALSQIAADELDVDLARIEMVSGDTARTPNEGQTAG